jgi:hypothetical protein
MSKTLQTYYQEHLQVIQQLTRATSKLIAEDRVGAAIDQLIQFDENLSEALDLVLDKRRLTKNERGRQNNTIFTEQYEVSASQIAQAVLSKIKTLKQQLSQKNQDFPFKDLFLPEHFETAFGKAAPYKTLFFAKELLNISRCICQVQVNHPKGLQSGSGLLIEGNFLITAYELLPDANTAKQSQIKTDYLDGSRSSIKSYALDANTWTGDPTLNFVKIKVQESLSTWNMFAGATHSPKRDQLLLILDNGQKETLEGHLHLSSLQQFTDPFLIGDQSDQTILPGSPVFTKSGQIVGLHHGSQTGIDRMTAWSAIEYYEPVAAEPVAAPIIKQPLLPNESLRFQEHHKYTCDRIEHNDRFTPYTDLADQHEQDCLHFFYLYGGERQEHLGLFNRFVTRLQGRDKDYIQAPEKGLNKVEKAIISFPRSFELANLKIELPVKVFLEFRLEQKQIEKIEHKCLADALKYPNSLLYQLRRQDKVCLMIEVTESVWDPKLTPQVVTWFIEDFCQKNLPDNSPEFFLFFAINYDDEDHEDIQEEVLAALDNGKYTEALFPVLDMVQNRDIKAWFDEYAVFWGHDRKRIRQVRNRHFGDTKAPRFMEDVQEILKDVIEEVNQENN